MIMVFLLACTVGAPTPTVEESGVPFPHPSGYDAGGAHGPEARQLGAVACLGCHRDDATSAPTCASCHTGYPHAEGWLAGAVHGAGLTGDTGPTAREACTACHGVDGLDAQTCTACHASWPHPADWELAGQHGVYALARGSSTAACGSCHGAGLAGTATAPSCTACHSGYPHPEGWSDREQHGAADLTTCASCHGEGGSGGSAEVACSRCHATYPHPAGWASDHLGTVTRVGQAVCLDCHDDDPAPALPAACGSSCHGGAP